MLSPDAKQNRTDFEVYLRGKLPIGSDPAKFSRTLDSKIKQFYKTKLQKGFETLYSIIDENKVFTIKQEIVSHPSLVYHRGKSGDSRIEGLDMYIGYLRNRTNSSTQSSSTVSSMPKAKRVIKRSTPAYEGKHIEKETVVIQRNRAERQKCVDHYKCTCVACGLRMKDKYGELGDGVIEVHHLNPIHLFDDSHRVNYLEDLVTLCPNCHTMIHKLADPGDIEGLKQIIEENKAE